MDAAEVRHSERGDRHRVPDVPVDDGCWAGLEVAVETYGGRRLWVTMERSDDDDGGGWWPSRVRPYDEGEGQADDEPDGWPW